MSEVSHVCAGNGDFSAGVSTSLLSGLMDSMDHVSVLTSSNLPSLLSDSSPNILIPAISSLFNHLMIWVF